jgi:hypothetical protein
MQNLKFSNAFPSKFQTAFFSNTQKWIYSILEPNSSNTYLYSGDQFLVLLEILSGRSNRICIFFSMVDSVLNAVLLIWKYLASSKFLECDKCEALCQPSLGEWGHAYFICWITESPHFKYPKVKKKIKVPHYNFSPAFFFPPLICVANKTFFSIDHIGRAYKSAIPRGWLICSAVLLLET